jgi:predicted nucleic acid-binding protein
MTFLRFPASETVPLVLDTSVIINLHASTYGHEILKALSNDVLVTDIVVRELEHQTSRENGDHQFIQELMNASVIKTMSLDDQGYDLFARLVTQTASLGDGEAATIAAAYHQGATPVLDDKKGRTVAQGVLPNTPLLWSLDMFFHPLAQNALGKSGVAEAVYLALREGRMRIDEAQCEAVVGLIGSTKALDCICLPNFRARRTEWLSELHTPSSSHFAEVTKRS